MVSSILIISALNPLNVYFQCFMITKYWYKMSLFILETCIVSLLEILGIHIKNQNNECLGVDVVERISLHMHSLIDSRNHQAHASKTFLHKTTIIAML